MKVAILGNGQLGDMMRQAGQRIGIEVNLLDIDNDELPGDDVIITAEREHWPDNAFTSALQGHPGWLNRAAFAALTNRQKQKAVLDELDLPTAPWCIPEVGMTQADLHQQLGPDIFLKSASGGYDGRGQQRLRLSEPKRLPDWFEDAVAEQAIIYDTEVSIIGARNAQGKVVCYRLTENRHDHGVLTMSLSINASDRFSALQAKAKQMLNQVMEALDYIGVMTIEFFVVGEQLLINEIAPRVHNSGHWTQAGASISQFELHIRAVCSLPLPQPEQPGASMMINLLGTKYDQKWLDHSASQLHWYGKNWRPGRKMGHLNFYHQERQHLARWLADLDLPASYAPARAWALARLQMTE
ncbi:MAG: ATP-grasp domain-containing protein [Undibacterium sp.]|nr:ATP-grasp domain-containing protein [Undibacterium sp.]